MPTPDPLRSRAVRAAAQLLAELTTEGVQPGAGPVEVSVSDGDVEVRVTVRQVPPAGNSRNGQQETAAPHLTPLDQMILDRATSRPVTMERLARLCGHEPDSYFQGRARRLRSLGLLAKDFDGWRRA